MILVDTSVWVDHLRHGDGALARSLDSGQVAAHPFVIGEVALGHLRQREQVLNAMRRLPQLRVASDSEVLHFIGECALFGRGIGYVDAHLLASLRLTPGTHFWTLDRRLSAVAEELGLSTRQAR